LLITHNDSDHAALFDPILEEFPERIRSIAMLQDRSDDDPRVTEMWEKAWRWAQKVGRPHDLVEPQIGRDGRFEIFTTSGKELDIYCVHPPAGKVEHNTRLKAPQPNAVSVILCLDIHGETEVIWPGDAGMRELAAACQGKSPKVIVGPHHGGPFDRELVNYKSYFDDPKAEYVFVSAGTTNGDGHPLQKDFIDLHRDRGRCVSCSEIKHCDNRRIKKGSKGSLLRRHTAVGLLPPRNPDLTACRGPMILTWDGTRLVWDKYGAKHAELLNAGKVQRPRCRRGL